MKRIIILFSGRGSNLEFIAQACQQEKWNATIVCAISDRSSAKGIEKAKILGLDTKTVEFTSFSCKEIFEQKIIQEIEKYEPDLVVLAGFMRILSTKFVSYYQNKMMNIHPSLLPAFRGLNTHKRALEERALIHGATVHFVSPELDAGPIIAQSIIQIRHGEDEYSLAKRVLDCEHRIYPLCIKWFLNERLILEEGRVRLLNPLPHENQVIFEELLQ